MGIFERLGQVIKGYLHEDGAAGDPDLSAAFEELDDYLNRTGPGDNGKHIPEELRPDFAELGIPFGASGAECKGAYKKLLKIHHPDRHGGHPEHFKKATDKTAGINAAYDRIEKWRNSTGNP
jgi:DnaJ-domain-containing protein 1